jgi:hypothetical protein
MPDRWGRLSPVELAAAFRHFARNRCGDYAPLYAHLGHGMADDPWLLALAAHASPGQSPPDLMLAAVHYLLASQPAHQLARYYPTLTAAPEPAPGAFPHFRAFCRSHHEELAALIAGRLVQTNEVRRCCYLLPAIMVAAAIAGRPLALIEAGASAGLNLALDSYAYDYGTGRIIGDPGSPLTLRCTLKGGIQPPLGLPVPAIAWRTGADLNPLNLHDADDAAWLRALVWPDHRERAALLNDALRAAASRPPVPVHAGDAAETLPGLVGAAPAGTALCVFHTAFLAHFPARDRERFERLVVALSTARPVYWVQAEPRSGPAEPRLRLTVCENGSVTSQRPLGHYHPHGDWLQWAASSEPPRPQPVQG